MTKIPSVEIVEATKAKITDTLTEHDYISDWVNTGIDLIVESLQAECTAQREAGAREALLELEGEARLAIVEWENSADYDHTTNDGLYLFCQTIALKRKALTPPIK